MVSRALKEPASGVPTYGELLTLTRQRAEQACVNGSGPFASAQEAADAVAGFERYLAVIGRHLRFVAAPGLSPDVSPVDNRVTTSPVLPQLVRRMNDLRLAAPTDSAWSRATESLATAHDLLSTHLGPDGRKRTPDIEVLADPPLRQGTIDEVLSLLDAPLAVRDRLLAASTGALRNTEQAASARATASHVRQSTDAIRQLATTYRSSTPVPDHDLTRVTSLTPALVVSAATSPRFIDALHALRVLRLLSFRQSAGDMNSSPGCLHDLARLARTTLADADQWLPHPQTPIARIQLASTLDQTDVARQAWEDAAAALGQHVRGLTRAPRLYADAIHVVQHAHAHDGVRRAVLAALPRLGREAGLATTHLASRDSLVVATRRIGRTGPTWRLLSPAESDALAAHFIDSGHATQTAYLSVDRLERQLRGEGAAPAVARTNSARSCRWHGAGGPGDRDPSRPA